MENKPICDGSLITKDQVEEILHEYFKTPATLDDVDGKVISRGLGFLSDVIRLNLYWSDKSNKTLPNKVIVKAPKVDNLQSILDSMGNPEIDAGFVPMVHKLECTALEMLERDKPIKTPHIYGYRLITVDHPGMIVMEDMGDTAVIVNSIADGISLAQWKSVVFALADLHAWSLTTDMPWRERLPGVEALSEFFKSVDESSGLAVRSVKEKFPDYFGDIDTERATKELSAANMMERHQVFRDLTDEVMLHGDTWLNNIMFVKNIDGSMGDEIAAFLDWQMSTRGPGINDLTRFESWCVNHEMRRANWESMLRMYYDRVVERAGVKCKVSFENMKKAYKMAFSTNGLISVIFLEMMLKTIAKVDEDETGRRKEEMLNRAKAAYDDAAAFLGW